MVKDYIEVDGKRFVPESSIKQGAEMKDCLSLCIIRTYSAGVFYGWVDRSDKSEARTIYNSRRVWYWDGAASLSQLANDGSKRPSNCKIAQIVGETDLMNIIEVIPVSESAKTILDGIKVWEK